MTDKTRTTEFTDAKLRLEEIGSKMGELFGKPAAEAATGGIFAGLGSMLEQLGKLAEHGALNKSGELDSGTDKRIKGVYGFTIKTALGNKGGIEVEPFGNIKKSEDGKLVEVQQIREPMIDLFDEPDHLLVVAEVPGITQEEVRLELHDDILIFSAENAECKYRKEVLLPASFASGQMNFTCHNGLLKIRLNK